MRWIFVLIAAVAATQASPLQRGLIKDVMDFAELIPFEDIKAIYAKYANDQQVVAIVEYTLSEDLNDAIGDVYALPKLQDLIEWVLKNLLSMEARKQALQGKPTPVRVQTKEGGWRAFVDEVKAVIPSEDLEALAQKKIAEGGTFAEFVKQVQDCKDLYEQMIQIPSVVKYLHNLRDLGVDIEALDNFIRTLLGWK